MAKDVETIGDRFSSDFQRRVQDPPQQGNDIPKIGIKSSDIGGFMGKFPTEKLNKLGERDGRTGFVVMERVLPMDKIGNGEPFDDVFPPKGLLSFPAGICI